ncbi:MAG TPA: tripartite tricarboxylate transporter TctB family protein [Intrasporangium sp.]|nr:tripartite tricarboxylate transporter TctB family protein [Intrasporangium sp.]
MSTEPEAVQTEPAAGSRRVPWGEWAITAGLLAIGVVVLLDGLGQRASSSASGVGAGFMPKIVGVLLIVLALGLALEIARGHLGEAETAEGDVDVRHTKWVPLAVCIAAALVFIAGIEQLGYIIVSTVAFWLTAWAMGARRHLRSALIAVVLSVVVYVAFTRLLEIDLPAGVLEGIL